MGFGTVALWQTDRAVQLLLETSAENPSYYCDSLKACLVTTIPSSGPSQSTIKLVATNMIASGKLAGMWSAFHRLGYFS